MEVISREGTTAQIDPLRFCQWLLSAVEKRGVTVHHPARATSITKDSNGVLSGLRIHQDDAETEREAPSIPNFCVPCANHPQYRVRVSS